jgi:peroxidase
MWRERQPQPLLVAAAALVVTVVSPLATSPEAALQVGFYHETCPVAEDVVLAEMRFILMEDATVAPALLRMHYHDCFVQVNCNPAYS